MRDLRIYSQTLDATLSSWRDSQTDAEIDVVLELPNGRWAAFEIKLGEAAADAAAASLLHLRTKSTPSGTVSRWLSSSSSGGRFTCTRRWPHRGFAFPRPGLTTSPRRL